MLRRGDALKLATCPTIPPTNISSAPGSSSRQCARKLPLAPRPSFRQPPARLIRRRLIIHRTRHLCGYNTNKRAACCFVSEACPTPSPLALLRARPARDADPAPASARAGRLTRPVHDDARRKEVGTSDGRERRPTPSRCRPSSGASSLPYGIPRSPQRRRAPIADHPAQR